MDDLGNLLDLPSPANSLYYVYGDPEQYGSGSQSPSTSTYDMTSAADISNLTSAYPSPGCEEAGSPPAAQEQKPAAKRKRENRYKNAPPSVLSRRRAQNRASQRAYRERKDQRIKDLEQMLNDAKQRNDVLSQAYAALHAEYLVLKTSQLKDHSYHQQVDLAYSSHPSMGPDTNAEGLDMDMYVYGDMNTGYPL
ncbi:AP-1-like transcription factor YAP1 [Madurella mycetomatis]|uniref:Putative transcription factor kapC n=1 Tax=Madurella mycetomatis TaxID=100816 RepID=A0A175WDQ0_9PEZI|nr:AP-1-like transcription factor YAP1 [Madurella mycetomatis]